jgi:hypothetical protein
MLFQRDYWKLDDKKLEALALKYRIGAGTQQSGYDRKYAIESLMARDLALQTRVAVVAALVSIISVAPNVIVVIRANSSHGGVVEATNFMLRDTDGRVRATLATAEGSPSLMLYDARGTSRASLGVDSAGRPKLQLYDANDKVRATTAVVEEIGPTMMLFDADGKTRFSLETDSVKSKIGLYDVGGQASANLGVGLGGGSMLIENKPGSDIQLALTKSGLMALTKGDKILWNVQ